MTKRFSGARFALWSAIALFLFGTVAIAATLLAATARHVPLSITNISDSSLPAEVQTMEAETLPLAFDRSTATEHVLYGPGSITVALENGAAVSKLRTQGASPYELSVEKGTKQGNGVSWSSVSAAQNIDLSTLGAGWNDIGLGGTVQAAQFRLTLTPIAGAPGSGLSEIEFWGPGQSAVLSGGFDAAALLGNATSAGPVRRIELGGTVGISKNSPTDTVGFDLPYAPSDIRSAWLSYELRGVHSWLAVRRSINGGAAEGGYVAADESAWSAQMEPISPEQLVQGANTVTFGTLTGQEKDYSIRSASLIVALDDGHGLVTEADLTDGDTGTGRLIFPNADGVSALSLGLSDHRAVDTVSLTFDTAPNGSVEISGVAADGTSTTLAPIALAAGPDVTVDGLSYTLALGGLSGAQLDLVFDGVPGSFSLVEADASGSPDGGARLPERVMVTWPQAGEFYGRTGFLRGHVLPTDNGSGPAQIYVAGLPFDLNDGSFEVAISKDQAGYGNDPDEAPWSVEVAALYPNGETAVTSVLFDTPVFIEGLSTYTPGVLAETFNPGEEKTVGHEEAELTVTAGALAESTEIRVSALTDIEVPKLDTGLINVTKGPRHGYRMLPHMKFNANVALKLPFNKNRIPQGYTEADVRIFYFDESLGRWQALASNDVDAAGETVTGETDHFTDFIAGVVVAPESPQVASYNPTQLKDMKVADPSAKINLIAAPQATSSGDATMSYPIELPPGRQGLAPQLQLSYSSGGGNGLMGMGWNLSAMEVTVDTRWGVPRYSRGDLGFDYSGLETETYLLNGQQLTPVFHRTAPADLPLREADRVFQMRVEGSFMRIVRKGDSPSNYWWEVTDKMGTTYAYGGSLSSGAQDPSSVLTDAGGNVYKWALNEVRDSNGNTITYDHATVTDTGLNEGTVPGKQLYCTTIHYTGHNGSDGPFRVDLIRDRDLAGFTRRADTIIDGRGGFKMVTADLLKRIEVHYDGDADTPAGLVRAYDFDYETGAFYKTLLTKVTQYDANNAAFNTHTFEYFDDAREANGTYKGFADAIDWSQPGLDQISANGLDASAISGNEGDSETGHLHIGVGIAPTKYVSIGAKVFGRTNSTQEGRLQLIDINGDGLSDKVFVDGGGSVYWRKNEGGPSGLSAFAAPKPIGSISQILYEESETNSNGIEIFFGASFGLNWADTETFTRVYFTDANGDGLPDLNANGTVLFNVLDANGEPTFVADSATSAYPVGAASVDVAAGEFDLSALLQRKIDAARLLDNLRGWTAPFGGTVDIGGTVALLADAAAADYGTEDGVEVSIELNGTTLFTLPIAAGDHAVKPASVSGVNVAKGDTVYFRIQSGFDGAFDQVAWDPSVTYTSLAPATDANGLSATAFGASGDFILFTDGVASVPASFNGTLVIDGILAKPVTTDDLSVEIRKVSRALNGTVTTSVVASQTLAWNVAGSVDLATLAGGIPVQATEVVQVQTGTDGDGDPIYEAQITQWGDVIEIAMSSDSPIDVGALSWTEAPHSYYTAISDPGQDVTDPDTGDYTTEAPFSPAITHYAETDLTTPLQPWTAAVAGTVQLTPAVTVSDPGLDTTLWLTVKSQGQRIAKAAIPVVSGVPSLPAVSFDTVLGQEYFIEVSGSAPGLLADVTIGDATIEQPAGTIIATHDMGGNGVAVAQLVNQPYRGWRSFGYDGSGTAAGQPVQLTVADLTPPTPAELAAREAALRAALATPNDLSDDEAAIAALRPKVYGLSPDVSAARWETEADGELWTAADTASASRLGDNFPSVPDPTVFAGLGAVPRWSVTDTDGNTKGLFFISGSSSDTSTRALMDYLDMNGDRFPDVVKDARSVQFSPAVGGLETGSSTIATMAGQFRTSTGDSDAFGIGGTFPIQEPDGSSNLSPAGTGRDGGNGDTQQASLGISANWSDGTSDVTSDLRDMNADGLPDMIRLGGSGIEVAYNLGYEFAPFEPFSAPGLNAVINDGFFSAEAGGGSIGFNDGIFGFAGSLNESTTLNKATESLLDINGDGLMDLVREGSNGNLAVYLNTGSGFDLQKIDWSTGTTEVGLADNITVSDSIGGYVTKSFGLFVYVIINAGADFSDSMSRLEISIQDMDGDGFPEYLTSDNSDELSVSLDTIERTNMLRQVNRPLGSTIALAYERSGNTTDQPQNKWVMSRVEVFDGYAGDGVDLMASNFSYEGGQWDREEREFYGYASVTEDHMNTGGVTEAVYRSITREYLNQTYYEKGLLARSTTADAAGNLFLETLNTYDLVDVSTGTTVVQPDSLTATVFPQLIRTDNQFYEGQAVAGKATYQTFAYGGYGNVVEFFDAANLNTADDDVTSTIGYHEDLAAYIVGKADSVVVTGLGGQGPGGAYRERQAAFEPGTGNMLQLSSVLETGDIAVTDLSYDQYGNLANVTGPANLNGDRYALDYTFDGSVSTYVTAISDSFGYTSSAFYDERFGELLQTVDLNAQPMAYALDDVGRIVTVTGPYEAGSGEATIEFAYHPVRDVPGDAQYPDVDVSWALTRHIDAYRNLADDIETALFIDGLGRVLQTKKDAAIYAGGSVTDKMVASGRIEFDFLGRQTKQWYPVEEALGSAGVFNPTYDEALSGVPATQTDYDILDRPVRVEIPDGTDTEMYYDFGPDRLGVTQFRTLFVDAEANMRETFADVRKLMTSVKEMNPGGGQPEIWTSYLYDPLRQITQVRDDHDNLTHAEYDNFGRMTALDSPDMGRTTYSFDLASNLIAKQTANLAAEGTSILYDYDFNRLATVTYPTFTENNVAYTYGAPGAAFNRANRIVTVTSEGGTEERFYGPLGEMVKQIRTINSDTIGNGPTSPEIYTTEWTFDTWNRVQEMIYPDGEVLTNAYDSGGKLQTIDGAKTGYDYPYLQLMGYDKFGQRVFLRAGNGTETSYSYVPTTRRLATLDALSAQTSRSFQALSYEYDNVGNITGQANAAGVNGANELGGATDFTYIYDDLYRLTYAKGTWEYMPNKTEEFELWMAYDTIHNITSKDQDHDRIQPSNTRVPQKKTTYDWTYTYGSPQPHAPSLIGDRAYSYDLNGNQTGWDHVSNGTRRTITWDEENRIQEVADNGHIKSYKYDDAGERVIKRGPQGETAYVNQFFTMRNREVGTKHVFAGGTRLVSKLVVQPKDVDGDGEPDPLPGCDREPWGWTQGNGGQGQGQGVCNNNGNGPGAGPEVFEKDQYYYHPDHLGSSSYVTDLDGEIFQHLEYFPFGETWVEEHSNTQRTPYLFTAKELDEETGLYYFGARYYDPRTSIWQSPDPILAEYMGGSPSNGVYSSKNLGLFSYSHNRPLNMVDPTGESPIWDWFMTQSESDRENTFHAMRHYSRAETISRGMLEGGRGYDMALLESLYRGELEQGDFFMSRVGQGAKSRIFWDSLQAAEIVGTLIGGGRAAFSRSAPLPMTTAQMARATRATAHTALRSNLLSAGQVARREAASPHHIVAWGHELAAPSRRILERFGIGINSAENGVFLPWTKAQANRVGGVAHATLGNNHGYMRWVNQQIRGCSSRDCVINKLSEIGKALDSGQTPWMD